MGAQGSIGSPESLQKIYMLIFFFFKFCFFFLLFCFTIGKLNVCCKGLRLPSQVLEMLIVKNIGKWILV